MGAMTPAQSVRGLAMSSESGLDRQVMTAGPWAGPCDLRIDLKRLLPDRLSSAGRDEARGSNALSSLGAVGVTNNSPSDPAFRRRLFAGQDWAPVRP
jgi:hypothetical protein